MSESQQRLTISLDALSVKAQKFVLSFVDKGDATKAYVAAGYKSEKNGCQRAAASRMIRKPGVALAIKEITEDRFQDCVQKLQRMAGADIADYELVVKGNISLTELRDEYGVDTTIIKKLKRTCRYDKEGCQTVTTEIELYSVTDAIDRLMKIHGIADKIEVNATINTFEEQMDKYRHREAENNDN